MEDENKDIKKDKIDDVIVLIFSKFLIIFGMLLIVIGFINDSGGVIFLGLTMVLIGSCLLVGQKKEQEMLGKKQSSQETIQIDKKIAKKFSIKIFIEKIRNKIVKVFKTIFSNLCLILSSPITTNIILIIIVCMLSGIKNSVVHPSDYSLSSSEVTSAIKDALDDYGFIQVRRY